MFRFWPRVIWPVSCFFCRCGARAPPLRRARTPP